MGSGAKPLPQHDRRVLPDFSCCRPKLGWQLERRAAFVAADQETREKMMLEGIEALVGPGVEVHVTRGEPTDHE